MDNKKIVIIVSSIVFIVVISLLIFFLVRNNISKNEENKVFIVTLIDDKYENRLSGKKGDKVNLPILEKENFKFVGWIDSKNNIYNGEYVINDNITFNAKYAENEKYNINFITDESEEMITYKVYFDGDITYPSVSKDGYTLVYWMDSDGNMFDYKKYPFEKDIILTAVWEKTKSKEYTIKFDTDGGNEINAQIVLENNKVIKPNDPSKNGYCFIGWTYNSSSYNFDNIVKNNMTLKAHYKELFSINESNFNLVKLKYSELSNKLGIKESRIKKGKKVSTNKGKGYYSDGIVIFKNDFYAYYNFLTFNGEKYSNVLNKQGVHYIVMNTDDLFINYKREFITVDNLKCLGYKNIKYVEDKNIFKFDYGKYTIEIYNFNTDKEKAYIWNIN